MTHNRQATAISKPFNHDTERDQKKDTAMSTQPDDLDTLSAIWILASNDENPLITYDGLTYRLGLPKGYDTRSVVKSRPELFRPGASQSRLDDWKSELREGRHQPGWIKNIADPQKRLATIEALGKEDVFRSQFRTHAGADRSPIEIIKWGLEHLDRLRKAKAEAKDAVAKKWQMWLLFWVSLAGVVSQFLIAFAKYKEWI